MIVNSWDLRDAGFGFIKRVPERASERRAEAIDAARKAVDRKEYFESCEFFARARSRLRRRRRPAAEACVKFCVASREYAGPHSPPWPGGGRRGGRGPPGDGADSPGASSSSRRDPMES